MTSLLARKAACVSPLLRMESGVVRITIDKVFDNEPLETRESQSRFATKTLGSNFM